MARVGFVGLGTMGLPMARNIVRGGHEVVGFDLDSLALARHAANAGRKADSPGEAASNADFVITMLPDVSHVRTALFGQNGVAQGLGTDTLLIEMSTIHPFASDAIRDDLSAQWKAADYGRRDLRPTRKGATTPEADG